MHLEPLIPLIFAITFNSFSDRFSILCKEQKNCLYFLLTLSKLQFWVILQTLFKNNGLFPDFEKITGNFIKLK